MIKKSTYFLLLGLIAIASVPAWAQISSPSADYTQPTAYTNGMPEDEIFVFCSPDVNGNPVTGSISATPTIPGPGYTFEWGIYDETTHTYSVIQTDNGVPTSTLSNLQSGGYNVVITNAAGQTETFITWVYVSIVDATIGMVLDPVNPGCSPFDVNGTIAASGFSYWDPVDPGAAPFIVDANTTITICFSANHTYVSDLGFVLVGPPGCGSPGATIYPHPQVVNAANGCCCNAGNNINNLCFSTANANQLNVCTSPVPLSGTYAFYNGAVSAQYPAGGLANVYGCNAAEGGWALQIYDCIGLDVGSLTAASITFDNGTSQIIYNSGPINSAINDNSCTQGTASIYVVPLTTPINPNPNQVPNQGNLSYTLGVNGAPVNLLPGTNNFSQTIDPNPTNDEWYYVEVIDDLGCSAIDSVMFDFTGFADATITDPIDPANPTNQFCVNDAAVQLTAVDGGGTWSGPGVDPVTGMFDPALAGVGVINIDYDIPAPCGDNDQIVINVVGNSDATMNNINALNELCEDEPAAQITTVQGGGTFSGNGTSPTGMFDPAAAGVGVQTVTYEITGNCPDLQTMDITVLYVNDATINNINPTNSLGIGAAPVQLTTVDPGGTFTGNGVSPTGVFDPLAAGPGVHTITYTIADPCGDVQTMNITVVEITFTTNLTHLSCFEDQTGQILFSNETGAAPYQYSIDGGQSFDPTNPVTGLAAGTYSVAVMDNDGFVSELVDVTLTEPTELTLTGQMDTQSDCDQPNGTASALAAGGTVAVDYIYQWSTVPVQNSAAATGLLPQVYTVTAVDDNGCQATDDVTITSTPAISVSIVSSTDPTCFGGCDGDATAVCGGTAVAPFSYVWNDPNAQTTATADNLCSGTYTVTATDDVGCTAITSVTLNDPVAVSAVVTADPDLICIGESSNLLATPAGGTAPYSYQWVAVPADPTLVSDVADPVVSPILTTDYGLIVTDANGCFSPHEHVLVTVNPPLTLDISRPLFFPDTAICPYDEAVIDLVATGGDGNYTYYLLPDQTNPVTLPMTVQPTADSTFDFIVLDGCTTPYAEASSTISLHPIPEVLFQSNVVEGCHPLVVNFDNLTVPAPAYVFWDFGDEASTDNNSNQTQPTHLFSHANSFSVTLEVTTVEGCSTSTMYDDYITVHPLPVADFTADPDRINLLQARINMTDMSYDSISDWSWNFGDGGTAFEPNPTHIYSDTGVYNVVLKVTSNHGCEDIAIRVVTIEPDFMFYIPTAFSPNQDGHNDFFSPEGDGLFWDTYEMTIYNRWGEEIFHTANNNKAWDGTYKGSYAEVGVYVYKIQFNDLNGDPRFYGGHVTLIR